MINALSTSAVNSRGIIEARPMSEIEFVREQTSAVNSRGIIEARSEDRHEPPPQPRHPR